MTVTPPQLDLFADSAAVMWRNETLSALTRRDAAEARAGCARLGDDFPGDAHLAPLTLLTEAIAAAADTPIEAHAELAARRTALAGPLDAAARLAFGAVAGGAWLTSEWRALASRCAGLPFHADHPEDHAAALWLQADDAARAADAAGRIESWRRIPAPLGWMTEAHARRDGLDAAWPLLVELAWLAPRRFDALTRQLVDPLLTRLRRSFEAAFEGECQGRGDARDLAWFPAWLLTHTPALAARLALAQPGGQTPPEQALRLLIDLLALERQGRHHDLLARRKRLRDLNESLYAIYLSTR